MDPAAIITEAGLDLALFDDPGNIASASSSHSPSATRLPCPWRLSNTYTLYAMTDSPPYSRGIELSADERLVLDDFLASSRFDERAMDLATLEGFLTAIVIGPNIVMPSRWMPWVWDRIDGRAAVPFDDLNEANAVLGLIMRLHNGLISRFQTAPEGFRPVYLDGAQWGASEWCEGFLFGTQLDSTAWAPLTVRHPAWFTPFLRLGSDDGLQLTMQDSDAEHWIEAIVPSLAKIHAFWLERRQPLPYPRRRGDGDISPRMRPPVVHGAPKVGRNDPCPCGSGKKYKKCCGAPTSTVH